MRVVISQSMLFPWVGLLEQIRLADIFVHYDDVQFSKGSFVNRVQIKSPGGVRWMTIPLHNLRLGQSIEEIQVAPASQWQKKHMDLLRRSFHNAPYADDALKIAEEIYQSETPYLGAIARTSVLALAHYFRLDINTRFVGIKELRIPGSSSERVLTVVKHLKGDEYITGHGAARYLNHELFEKTGVKVEYMNYGCTPYPQLHGPFTPYVSSLDLIANCGPAGIKYICSNTTPWRDYLNESSRSV